MNIGDWLFRVLKIMSYVCAFLFAVAIVLNFVHDRDSQPKLIEQTVVDAVVSGVEVQKGVYVIQAYIPTKYIVHFKYGDISGLWRTNRNNYEYFKNNIGANISCFLLTYESVNGDIFQELCAIADDY